MAVTGHISQNTKCISQLINFLKGIFQTQKVVCFGPSYISHIPQVPDHGDSVTTKGDECHSLMAKDSGCGNDCAGSRV